MKTTYTQADRPLLLDSPDAQTFRKNARILAIQMTEPFSVRADRGPMEGSAGDWLVTNHPDDDPGSDLWTISDERMRNTYVEEVEPDEIVLPGDPFTVPDDGTVPGIGSGSGEL